MLGCILTKDVIAACCVTMRLLLQLEVLPLMTLTAVLYLSVALFFFFFFQEEDGIRDYKVTGFRRVLFRSRCRGCGRPCAGTARRSRLRPATPADRRPRPARERSGGRSARSTRTRPRRSCMCPRGEIGRASCRERV